MDLRKENIMKYRVQIEEIYKRTVEVEADNSDKAYDKVDQMISEGEIDLPCDGDRYDYERFLTVNKED